MSYHTSNSSYGGHYSNISNPNKHTYTIQNNSNKQSSSSHNTSLPSGL